VEDARHLLEIDQILGVELGEVVERSRGCQSVSSWK
jgi:hypothetical protein